MDKKSVLIGVFATIVGGMAARTIQIMIKNKKENNIEVEESE